MRSLTARQVRAQLPPLRRPPLSPWVVRAPPLPSVQERPLSGERVLTAPAQSSDAPRLVSPRATDRTQINTPFFNESCAHRFRAVWSVSLSDDRSRGLWNVVVVVVVFAVLGAGV